MNHDLKIWPQYYCRVEDGTKTFEVRKNDRGYQPVDLVTLREWDPEIDESDTDPMGGSMNTPKGYTGRTRTFRVGYVLPIDAERVVFSLLEV